MEIESLSFFVLSLPSHLAFFLHFSSVFDCKFICKSYGNFLFVEFIFVMVKDTYLLTYFQGRSQILKQVPQNFMKAFNVDDVTLTS